jgi:hypothetical protein
MIDSISVAAQDRAHDTPAGTITLAQGFPSLRCECSHRRKPQGLAPASTPNMESTI